MEVASDKPAADNEDIPPDEDSEESNLFPVSFYVYVIPLK